MDESERVRTLVERHLELSRRAAAMVYPRVREHIEFEELVALANAGLAEAATRYDPARGASFATFAWYRVHGAIIDGLRRATNLPRRTWAKLVALRAASDYLEHRAERETGATQRGAAPASGAEALAAIRDAMSAIRTMYMTSLEAMREQGFDPDAETPRMDEQLDSARFATRLRAAIEELPAKERALMKKHYWEGKNLLEAGAELGISKSWASRLHAQAVERLRAIVDG
ncbi:MAG TPA: sigma-70 family RNA polymerase sigma factor [Kofleriaceae bacterium]|nr:sigma-70 family RNA polymerase sigma factor [Kofleriaceae bacterium]